MEELTGPLLLVCGEHDEVWPSCPMSRAVVERLDQGGGAEPVELFADADAGHWLLSTQATVTGDPRAGSPAWQRALGFLDETS